MRPKKYLRADVNPTVALTAYTAGDVVGGLLEFELDGVTVNGGIINKLVLIDEDSQAEPYKLYLFDRKPSTIADDAAFAPTVADLQKLVHVVDIVAGDYVTINSMDYVIEEKINSLFSSTTAVIYGYLVAGDTPDYANADTLQLTLYVASE